MRVRYEDFGAIIAIDEPPALVWVDREFVQSLGHPPSPRWEAPRGHLSAPTEVHLMTTERCPAGCPSCYVDATPDRRDPSTEALRDVLRRLAGHGVFHVAMGGGESLLRDDLFDLAAYARDLGMVPNLTTSGIGMNAELAAKCSVFGQVNVSLDGLGQTYIDSRGYDGAPRALRALRLLADASVSCGVNTVVNRYTFDELEQTAEAAIDAGAGEIELLRFKPAGRANVTYLALRLDAERRAAFMPTIVRMMRRWPDANIKIDCSFVPFLCAADPDPELLEKFGVIGCEAGNMLAAIRADLTATACSFVEEPLGGVDALVERWDDHSGLSQWRSYPNTAPEPCASCRYRSICKGGCKAVTKHLEGTHWGPDPECPRVVAYRGGQLA
jgi:radical SAM protein with 4Fe4S-binding SPASM domain